MFEISILQIVMAFVGVVIGIIFGALPGMTATMAIAICLPLTYAYELNVALFLLLGLYVGGISGGLIPAILVNIPGTPASIATGFDGYPMTLRGEGERALKIAIFSSLVGGIISLVMLWFFTPPLARVAISFSAVEKFLIICFAMTVIAALSKGSMVKGIFAGFLGVFVSLVGYFPDNAKLRMVPSFFEADLYTGFQLLPVLIGIFAITQIIQESEKGMEEYLINADLTSERKNFSFKDFKGQIINLIRSSFIGTFIGILPGVGGSAASLLSYSQAKNFSKKHDKFGTGIPDGVIASEASNNGVTGGALIPLLSLGIPGDSTTAVLVGAFMLQGISVGPLFITNHTDIWYSILIALFICNIMMFFIMFFPIKYIAKIIKLPKSRVFPIIILMCIVGAYSTQSGSMFDVWATLFFGVVGYIFSKINIGAAPFLIGFILGRSLEKYFIDSIKGSGGSLAIFFTRPMSWVIWALIIASIFYSIYDQHVSSKKAKN